MNSRIGSPISGWDTVRFGDVGVWHSGGTPSRSNPAYWNGHIPWVSPKDMKRFRLRDSIEYITESGAALGSRIVPPGTVLFVIRGMILAHTFPVGIATKPVAFNQDIKAVICNAETDSDFVGYWLVANAQRILTLASESTHGTKRFDLADLTGLPLHRPLLPEQRKIAQILTTVDHLIEKTEALIAKYQAIKRGMMHDLFTRGVDADGHLRQPQAEAPDFYKQSELGWIPKQWQVNPLDAATERVGVGLALSVTGSYREKGVPIIRNQNIRRGYFDDDDMLYLDPTFAARFPNKALRHEDVLTVRTGANVGDTALVPGKYVGCLTFTTLITTTKKARLSPRYLVHYIVTNHGVSELNRLLVGGGKENLNVGEFVKLRIPLPSIAEQDACAAAIDSIDKRIATERMALRKWKTTKIGLMQDLLTGKVRVNATGTSEEGSGRG